MAGISRDELATRIAIDRAEYERTYADRESGWQPLLVFVKDAAIGMAKRGSEVQGIRVTWINSVTCSVSARIDWAKLTKTVERRVNYWKGALEEQDGREATSV